MKAKIRDRLQMAAIWLGLLLVLALLVGATYGCREYRIDACRDDGGQPVVPAWFSEDPTDVRCIQS